jgi:tetratricopeptide (TPR) repeat protein
MTISYPPPFEPPALQALHDYPLLLETVQGSMMQQALRIISSEQTFAGRSATLETLHHLLHTLEGGLVALEGPPGSGVTALLAHLAAHHPFAFWLADDDARQGMAALAAQLIALHHVKVPLIPPAIQSDPVVLENLLHETVAQSAQDGPVVLLVDPPTRLLAPGVPLLSDLLRHVPPGVLVVYGCTPGEALPVEPAARVVLPNDDAAVQTDQRHILQMMECPAAWMEPVIAAAQGNMLYLRLAYGLLLRGVLQVQELQPGLDTLHRLWWARLDAQAQRLALLLAAAGEAIPVELCAALMPESDPHRLLASWGVLGIAHTVAQEYGPGLASDMPAHTAAFSHWTTGSYIDRSYHEQLAAVHADIARLARSVLDMDGMVVKRPDSEPDETQQSPYSQNVSTYLARQFARHAACGTQETRDTLLTLVPQRNWVRMQERRDDTLADAAHDMLWELYGAAQAGSVVRLMRSAAVAGSLVSQARTLSPDAAVAALNEAIEHYGRDAGLKRVRALVDQLPDGQAKALILRRMGEACYSLQMRTSAMRLLSQALDIEEQKQPGDWREQRDQLYTALASAALAAGVVDAALEIAGRIDHIERRGQAQTQVMRWLAAHGDVARAGQVAHAIEHESLRAWALAEVAVALNRQGNTQACEQMLDTIASETARAWAEIELACDTAAHDEEAARRRIDQLTASHQHDRGLMQLARALAMADKDGDALDAAVQIRDVAVRVTALLDLRLMLEGLVAMLALEQATAVIDKLERDVRVPLASLLAASYAALGRHEQALHVAHQFEEDEEQSRALSRVAVAMAQHGNRSEALEIARALDDEDERDWTLDELAHEFARLGLWEEAQQLCFEMSTTEQQARTLADLAIARARSAEPLAALALTGQIGLLSEYTRSLRLIAPILVARGYTAQALALVDDSPPGAATAPALEHRQDPASISRYKGLIVAALAEQGHLAQARELTPTIIRPFERARARLAIAQAAAATQPADALAELGQALCAALLGRDEAFRLLEAAVPVCTALGSAQLLCEVAAAIDEVENW